MDIHEIANVVAEWAATQPLIVRAWLFGSRVRGTARPDSDIDVAVEIRKLPGDTGARTTFTCEGKGLRISIQPLLAISVDLQWYGGPVETPTVHAGLEESSTLVYEVDCLESL
jgi:predicted nucleotidyltransferase